MAMLLSLVKNTLALIQFLGAVAMDPGVGPASQLGCGLLVTCVAKWVVFFYI